MGDPAALSELDLHEEYRSERPIVDHRLLEPLLARCIRFDRAAAGALEHVLPDLVRGLGALASGGGFLRLLLQFPAERGEEERDPVERFEDGLAGLERSAPGVSAGFGGLAELITSRRAEVFVCGSEQADHGVEPIAIFAGTGTESVVAAGWRDGTGQLEVLDVFTSWGPDADRVFRKRGAFETAISGATEGLIVKRLDGDVVSRLHAAAVAAAPEKVDVEGSVVAAEPTDLFQPPGIELRAYQEEALARWEANGRRGVLAMATGTGKTIAAMSGAERLRRSDPEAPLVLVVLTPLIHLVDQWAAEVRRWGQRPIPCYESSTAWLSRTREAIDLLRAGARRTLVLVSTHATAVLEPFRDLIATVPEGSLMLVGDEVHHLGAPWARRALPENAELRMGLSATPERSEEEGGTAFLISYFGDVVFRFGITEAIAAGALSPYTYHPTLVELDHDELDDYRRNAARIARLLAIPPDRREAALLAQLLNERSRILNNAKGKLAALREAVEASRPDRAIIYCAGRDQLSAVMDIMWERGIASRQFTGEEPRREREALLEGLGRGEVPVLIGIRCLDEGVDVPEARQAYLLASSGNPREFVQRRGRLLRLAPGKRRSEISDLVAIPTDTEGFDRELVRKEFRRVLAFAEAAENGPEAVESLRRQLGRDESWNDLGGG